MVARSVSTLPLGRTRTGPSCGTRKRLVSTVQCSNVMIPIQIQDMIVKYDRTSTITECLHFSRRYPTLSRFKRLRRYYGVRVYALVASLYFLFFIFLIGLGAWYFRTAGAFPSLSLGSFLFVCGLHSLSVLRYRFYFVYTIKSLVLVCNGKGGGGTLLFAWFCHSLDYSKRRNLCVIYTALLTDWNSIAFYGCGALDVRSDFTLYQVRMSPNNTC